MKKDFDYGIKVSCLDIVSYLLFESSAFTAEELNCYKSINEYNYYASGFVEEVGVKVFGYGKGMSFQIVSDTLTASWLLTEMEAKVVSVHCNCMAGLGEVCSHVGDVLFYIEAANKMKDSVTVTGEKAY